MYPRLIFWAVFYLVPDRHHDQTLLLAFGEGGADLEQLSRQALHEKVSASE